MIDLGKQALANRPLVHFIIAILLIGGGFAFNNMSKLEDPEIKVKQAMVITAYPGASAYEVELEVSDLLEKSIRSMDFIDAVISRSMNDLSMITVELISEAPDDEVEQYWDLLRRKVNDVQSSLPSGAMPSIIKDDFGDMYGMFYAITTEGFGDRELSKYTEMIKREIQSIKGIGDIQVYGEREECINVELIEEKMANLGVHPIEVLATLSDQSQTVYSGYYETGDYRLRVTVNDKYKTVDDIQNLLLQGHEDDQLYLRDIAKVSVDYEDPTLNQMSYDGKHAFGLAISAEKGTDITKLGRKVETKIEELKETRIPAGIEFHKVFFQPDRVKDSLGSFLLNLLESVIIVVVVLMFVMGFRSGLIIGTSLIIIVTGSFLLLNLFDGTLQRVSLAAFILAMGMLVDNAIVVIDGILVNLQRGVKRTEALTSIGRQTGAALLGATLIAILAFFPIFLSPDKAGVYVRDLFIVLAVSLLLSWILALTHVPIMADNLFKNLKSKNEGEIYNSKFHKALRTTLSWCLKNRAITVSIALFLVGCSIFCYRFLPQGFFPDMTYDQLYMEYKLDEGVNNTKVIEDLKEIENYLMSRDEITHITRSIGGTPARYNLVRSIADPSLSYGELIIDFKDSKSLVASMEEIQEYLSTNYPHAYVRLKRYNLMYMKYPIEAQFSGPDPAVLKELCSQAEAIMDTCPKTYLVKNDWEPRTPVITANFNQPIARNMGLTRQDVGISMLSATGGIPANVFYCGEKRQTIYLKSVDNNGNPIEGLENSPVFSMMPNLRDLNKKTLQGIINGSISEEDILEAAMRTVPLNQAVDGITVEWEDPVVIRYNGQRAIRAQCDPVPGVGAEEARQSIIKKIEAIKLPPGYSLQWFGEHKASTESMENLFKSYPLAIVLMIAILIMLFKDYKKPLIILCCLPLILIGVVFSVLISGKTFGFVAIVGALGIIGMMVKNGIVLMDEVTLQINQGTEPTTALLNSSVSRFRAVAMASLTTILGMIPLLTDDMFGSLAVTIMGGLFVGTMIILLIIPVLYSLFFRIKIQIPQEK